MKKILFVEDMPDSVELVRKIVTTHGYEFIFAPDAETGLQTAQAVQPDLILLDLGLPDYDGLTLAGWLRENELLKSVPIVALTAWPQETVEGMVGSYGFDGYIGKPIEGVNDFIVRIESFLK